MRPTLGLVVHLVLAESDAEALAIAGPAWEKYRWNLAAPRRLEAERRGLTQFMQTKDGSFGFVGDRPAGLPTREMRRDIDAELERFDQQKQRPHPNRLGGVALPGTPAAVREYMDEYVADRRQLLRLLVPVGRSHARARDALDRAVHDRGDAAVRVRAGRRRRLSRRPHAAHGDRPSPLTTGGQ
jgi:hypothetical protein